MKKIGIVTITDYGNLGNRLQNYAMQEICSQYGNVYSIVNNPFIDLFINPFHRIFKYFKKELRKIIKNTHYERKANARKEANFEEFNKFIVEKYKFKRNNFKKIDSKFDVFVAGSDQVWNPVFFKDNMYINMLGFTTKEKKLAISPSVAIETLSLNQVKEFKDKLKDFDYLSCREQQGADLIKNITGKDCVALIDPTLMLSADKWDKVSRKPKFHDDRKKYILLYFLGNMTKEYQRQIEIISTSFNLEVINIADKNSIYYTCGPSEFLYLIKNCEIMLTDSFHGSVFSYIYDKPLRIFKREDQVISMNTRLTNLMNKLHLSDDIYFNTHLELNTLFDVNYDKSYLKKEQDKFNKYLESYFNK